MLNGSQKFKNKNKIQNTHLKLGGYLSERRKIKETNFKMFNFVFFPNFDHFVRIFYNNMIVL